MRFRDAALRCDLECSGDVSCSDCWLLESKSALVASAGGARVLTERGKAGDGGRALDMRGFSREILDRRDVMWMMMEVVSRGLLLFTAASLNFVNNGGGITVLLTALLTALACCLLGLTGAGRRSV